jgi:hypothetical protein
MFMIGIDPHKGSLRRTLAQFGVEPTSADLDEMEALLWATGIPGTTLFVGDSIDHDIWGQPRWRANSARARRPDEPSGRRQPRPHRRSRLPPHRRA